MKILNELLGNKPSADSVIILDDDLTKETKTEIEKTYPQNINSALHKAAYKLVTDTYPKVITPARERELPLIIAQGHPKLWQSLPGAKEFNAQIEDTNKLLNEWRKYLLNLQDVPAKSNLKEQKKIE